MPSVASSLLAEVFPELVWKSNALFPPATQSPGIDGTRNEPNYGEQILGQDLNRQWLDSGNLGVADCMRLLETTLSRLEELQRIVVVEEEWRNDDKYREEEQAAAWSEAETLRGDYYQWTFFPSTYRRKCDLHALFMTSLPQQRLRTVLSQVLLEIGKRLLAFCCDAYRREYHGPRVHGIPDDSKSARTYLRGLLKRLCDVGLGGSAAERAFAIAADELLSSFIETVFGDLQACVRREEHVPTRNSLIEDLEDAVEENFCAALHAFLRPLWSLHKMTQGLDDWFSHDMTPKASKSHTRDESNSAEKHKNLVFWLDRARNRLREIRSDQSYDIIIGPDGPAKKLGLLDLRQISKDPYGRNMIAEGLERQIDRKLVHPGTSTVEVLDTYMLIIATLNEQMQDGERVDPSNVLLMRSAGPVRSFLRNREDAAKIVIMSLLEPRPSEGSDEVHNPSPRRPPSSTANFSGQISMAMYYHENPHDQTGHFEGHDLSDINWMPEPVDALSGHRFNLSLDALGQITTIAQPEAFVNELEHVLGDRLLKTDQLNFEVEMRLLKIFHSRFGETQIQACENMLNDMMESAKWNETVRSGDQPREEPIEMHDFQAKIISQAAWQELRWEKLQQEAFRLPLPMKNTLDSYDMRFAKLQSERYLEWVPQLGRVTVELELEDRSISEEVSPLQAAVIHEFASSEDDDDGDVPPHRSVSDLCESLQADEPSISFAVQFWVSKAVLQPSRSDSTIFAVRENLSATDAADDSEADHAADEAAAAQAQQPPSTAMDAEPGSGGAARSRADLLADHSPTYAAYIVGMLTNQGAMQVERIHSLLRMLAPGGFAFDQEELVGLLEDMRENGQVNKQGALWRIATS